VKKPQKRKARRLAAAESQRKLAREPAQRECHITATRTGDVIAFQTRTGYFAPRTGPAFMVHELEIADACDNPQALVETIMKAGISVLAGTLRTPVSGKKGTEAIKALAEAAAAWMKLDLEALRKEIAEERAAQAQANDTTPAEVTEPTTAIAE
jgi:hypothetical protein